MKRSLLAALLAAIVAGHASAAVTIDVVESGPDVVATGSGTLDLTGLVLADSGNTQAFAAASFGYFLIGNFAPAGTYRNHTGPADFGTGSFWNASSTSGDIFGIQGNTGVFVPLGYQNGTSLAGSATWAGRSFASMGLLPGRYTWTWSADSLTLNIGTVTPVPEPGTWALMAAGLGVVAWGARRRAGGPRAG